MIRRTVLLVALVSSATLLHGQEPGKAGKQISFRVTRFDPMDAPPPEFRAGTGGGQVDLKIPLTYIDGPFKASLRDEKFLDFWRGEGEKPEISVAVAATERKDLLLVFIPDKETFRILKINAAQKRLKGGDRYILNACSAGLAIKLGETAPVMIAPGKAGIVPGPGGAEIKTLPVLIKQQAGEDWRLVSTEFWNCDPRFRKYLFVYPSPRTQRITFHGVSERL